MPGIQIWVKNVQFTFESDVFNKINVPNVIGVGGGGRDLPPFGKIALYTPL
jgi:hypothetical protein